MFGHHCRKWKLAYHVATAADTRSDLSKIHTYISDATCLRMWTCQRKVKQSVVWVVDVMYLAVHVESVTAAVLVRCYRFCACFADGIVPNIVRVLNAALQYAGLTWGHDTMANVINLAIVFGLPSPPPRRPRPGPRWWRESGQFWQQEQSGLDKCERFSAGRLERSSFPLCQQAEKFLRPYRVLDSGLMARGDGDPVPVCVSPLLSRGGPLGTLTS